MQRASYNFAGGVGQLPEKVIAEVQEAVHGLPQAAGQSVLVLDHRSRVFREMVNEAEDNLRRLLAIPKHYHILFLQGGASLQFSMVAMNLLRGRDRPASHIISGYWSALSVPEAQREGRVHIAWDGQAEGFVRTPCQDELAIDPGAAYLHYCSNETVEGVQFSAEPGVPVPLVCDMSSDFLTRELDVTRYGVIYVHAQKNLGTAGVTVVVVRGDLLNDAAGDLHTMLDYRTHVKARSIYNTPPLLPIYVLLVMTRWMLRDVGGLAKAAEQTREKAAPIYQAIDRSEGFYRGHAEPGSRSAINVTFDVAGDFLRQRFLEEAGRAGLVGLGGHRSLGGLRASFYVPMPVAGALALRDFMLAFQERHQARCATLLVGEGAAP